MNTNFMQLQGNIKSLSDHFCALKQRSKTYNESWDEIYLQGNWYNSFYQDVLSLSNMLKTSDTGRLTIDLDDEETSMEEIQRSQKSSECYNSWRVIYSK